VRDSVVVDCPVTNTAMTSHTRVKVPPPKPAFTVRTRSVTGCVWQTTWRAPVWRCALLYSDRASHLPPAHPPGQFAVPAPRVTAAATKLKHLYDEPSTISGTGDSEREAKIQAVLGALPPHVTKEVVVKVLSVTSFDVPAAVEMLLDSNATRQALSQWGKADKRGRTPTRSRPSPAPVHAAAPSKAAAASSHIAVFRRGDPPPPQEEEADVLQAHSAQLRRMHRLAEMVEAHMVDPAIVHAGQPRVSPLNAGAMDGQVAFSEADAIQRAAAEEARLRREEQVVQQALVAAESQVQELRCKGEQLQRQRQTVHKLSVVRAGDAAHAAAMTAAEHAARGVDDTAAAMRVAVRAQCDALRSIIDSRERVLMDGVDVAHQNVMSHIADVRREAEICKSVLATALMGKTDTSGPGVDADAAVTKLNELTANLHNLMTCSPGGPVTVTFAEATRIQEYLNGMMHAFGSVDRVAPTPTPSTHEHTQMAAQTDGHVAETVSYALAVATPPEKAPAPAISASPASPASPPPPMPDCPEAFPPLPLRAHCGKARSRGTMPDGSGCLLEVAPAGPDSVSDITSISSSDGDANDATHWF
jgi:hypothetical protein